ncbi:MAG: T9SS type A sorting domain-containing protein [Bacteroidota bacterium]
MKKILFTLVLVVFSLFQSFSQNFLSAYTDKTPGGSLGGTHRIATDNMNNVINASVYSGTITVGNYSFTSSGAISGLIIKKDENDSLVWAKSLDCGKMVVIGGLYTDQQSNLYVTGYFGDSLSSSTLDCNPYPITVSSGYSNFVIKYAPDGTVLWSNSIQVSNGGAGSNGDLFRITGNGTDRIAVSSFFYNVSPQTVGSSVISPANGNLFYAVINDAGVWQHATLLGGTSMHISLSLAMAANNDVFISGEFKGNLNLGVAGTLSTLTSSPQDFVCKANDAGSFVWAKLLESSSWWRTEVLSDGMDVFILGTFSGTVNMGTTLTAANNSTYFAKIDNAGNYLWAKKYGSDEAHFYCATKNNNRIYLTGYTSPYVASNQFDAINLTYSATLPAANTFSCVCYLVEADLNGNALKGAAYSFNFATLNTQGMACTDSRVYLTGNVGSKAAFGNYVLISSQINASNYVAQFTDSANLIKGSVYYDLNSNHIFDAGDANLPTPLTITKGSSSCTVVASGLYAAAVGKGTYLSTVAQPPLYYTYTPSSYTSVFSTLSNQVDSLNDFAFQPVAGQNDLVVDLVMGQLRPGFHGIGYATVKNIGTTFKLGSMSILLNHPDITIDSCIPAPLSILAYTATLAYSLSPTQQITYRIEYTVSASANIGSIVVASASALDVADMTPQNNTDTVRGIIMGSFDPNSKAVFPAGDITPQFVSSGQALEYIIHFQNTGNDTAFTVILADTISDKLNLSSFVLVSSSHPVVINMDNKQIRFRFYSINLPDSNTNEAESHGFVKYEIAPLSTCVVGDVIENRAYIYFDYNVPIVTNTTSTPIENAIGVETIADEDWALYPNPTRGAYTTIKSKSPISAVELFNSLGQKIQTVSANNVEEMSIATNNLPVGVYFVNIITQKGSSIHKLIKFE